MRMLVLLCAILFAGCSLPRVIVLNDPLDARGHNDLGVAYEARGEYDLAEREYARAAAFDRDWALPLVNRGNALGAAGDWRGAEASYRDALRREPQDVGAMNNLAWALLQRGRNDEALVWVRKALAVDPQMGAAFDTLAEVQFARGDLPAARAAVERGLALASDPQLRAGLEEKRGRFAALVAQ